MRYGFRDLLDDVAWWLVLGLVLSAIVEVALPANVFEGIWGGGVASMLLMLVLSIPLYTCAASSTPMAAALALKGLSPGAALVFLLAGPATNIGSLVVLLKVLGMRAVGVYLAAVAIMTLAAGFALNALYQAWGIDPRLTFGTAGRVRPRLSQNRRRGAAFRAPDRQHVAHARSRRVGLAARQGRRHDRFVRHPARPRLGGGDRCAAAVARQRHLHGRTR